SGARLPGAARARTGECRGTHGAARSRGTARGRSLSQDRSRRCARRLRGRLRARVRRNGGRPAPVGSRDRGERGVDDEEGSRVTSLEIGSPAPPFRLVTAEGVEVGLTDYRSAKSVVVWFSKGLF